ncbi:MAG: helix-turn-helix transcriptional regulator [Bacteroidaceae bacterium]|nr:helix-turn-helix transcriptional regulator [Bacteroidaceae bacterium]MBQ6693638.1 helix-turn-helix transcriptional regulator [Bacteroidaceae bacterium]MBR7166330.1 helix-turn-helix transcriptional regulator [Bacteroidaceae bacterium]
MDVIERIQKIIEHEKLSVSSFARKMGVGDQTIRGIVVQKRNKPGFDLIVKMLQTFDWVSAEWLLLGQGSMEKDENDVENVEYKRSLEELISYLKEKDEKIEKLIEEKTEFRVLYEMSKKEL